MCGKYGLEPGMACRTIAGTLADDITMNTRDGIKWDLCVTYASVHDKDGKYLRDCTYEDWEVCKANGIKEEMFRAEGREILGTFGV